jgi:hypothetical protein
VLIRAFHDGDGVFRVLTGEADQRVGNQETASQWHGANDGAAGFAAAQRVYVGLGLSDFDERAVCAAR